MTFQEIAYRMLMAAMAGALIGLVIYLVRNSVRLSKSLLQHNLAAIEPIGDRSRATSVIVTFFGIGHLKPAPGTWGSAAAVVLAVAAYEAGLAMLVPVGFVVATLAGFWAVPRAVAGKFDQDPSEIVIDEVAGQWLALCFTVLPLWNRGVPDLLFGAWPGWVVPFALFRLFDIWKPWLVGRADRRGDAVGVMLDDLWAGLFAGICSVILAGLYHGLT